MRRVDSKLGVAWRVLGLTTIAACGARTGLDVSGARGDATSGASSTSTGGGGGTLCPGAPPAPKGPCVRWTAGAPIAFTASFPSAVVELSSAIATPCNVLVAWRSIESAQGNGATWRTSVLGFDGARIAPDVAHPSLDAQPAQSGVSSLAVGGGRVAMLAQSFGACAFLDLDVSGNETAAIAKASTSCADLAWTAAGWTFLRLPPGGVAPLLVRRDVTSGAESTTTLDVSENTRIGARAVFDDGAFVLSTFTFNPTTSNYDASLAAFEASGAKAHAPILFPGPGAPPLTLVPHGNRAWAAWAFGGVWARSIDRLGQPVSAAIAVEPTFAASSFALDATPLGDALVAWSRPGPSGNPALATRALGADGAPRGPIEEVGADDGLAPIFVAVEPSGARALLLRARVDRLEAIPLACVTAN